MDKNIFHVIRQRMDVAKNLIYAILASMLPNFAQQFLLYPSFTRVLGDERAGQVLFFITLANTCAMAFGGACNSVYLLARKKYAAVSGDFFCTLLILSVVSTVVCGVVFQGYAVSAWELVLVMLLIFLSIFRDYSFVDFQLRNDYAHYFLFSMIVSGGYVLFIPLFQLTGSWAMTLLPATFLGLVYVWWKGKIYRQPFVRSEHFPAVMKDTTTLSGSYLLKYGAQNADRILLLPLVSGQAVTYYYIASLFSKTVSMLTGPINNLIISYLSQRKDPVDRKTFTAINILMLLCTVVGTAVVSLVSPWLLALPFLYPDQVEQVRGIIPLASLAQLLVICSSVIQTLDLVITAGRLQMFMQATYAIAYVVLAVPMTIVWGLEGFVVASCLAAALRYAVAFLVGYRNIPKKVEA